jgi:surface antigen
MGAGPTGLKTVLLASILVVAAPLTALHAKASTLEHKRPASHPAATHHEYVRGEPVHHGYVHREPIYHASLRRESTHHAYVRHAMIHHGAYSEALHHIAFGPGVMPRVMIRHAVARRFEPLHRWVRRGGISCVPFARSDSGIDLTGNAWEWWGHAAGVYARGSVPEPGSVLAFRANPHMRLGHVAVVSRIVNRREIEIDQANWWSLGMRGGVSRDVPVVDVSEANDWTAVRVGLGYSDKYGAVYPTYGFIYDRPDTGMVTAEVAAPAPEPRLNPAPRDLRPAVERPWQTYEEVAEAPETPPGQKPAMQPVNPGRFAGNFDRN